MDFTIYKTELEQKGFVVIPEIYTDTDIMEIEDVINKAYKNADTFRKSADLFAIRQFLNEVPETKEYLFNSKLQNVINQLFGENYFPIKSIYFDKPGNSNWFVAYHQDLTISVDKKIKVDNFGPWTVKQNQFAVQPPLTILENIYTIRIHLDETNENNGALKVIPASHRKQIYRPETIDWNIETEVICNVPKGGIMIMKPLLLHASGRTTNSSNRRVAHIEFSNIKLPEPLQWSEKININ